MIVGADSMLGNQALLVRTNYIGGINAGDSSNKLARALISSKRSPTDRLEDARVYNEDQSSWKRVGQKISNIIHFDLSQANCTCVWLKFSHL